jgi:hypothetical protein
MPVSNNNDIKKFKWEYTQFLEFVKQRKPQRAMIYAKALGIDRRTLTKWMSQQELRDAMADAVDEILAQMQTAGGDDWRMWDRMLELSGVTVSKEVDMNLGGDIDGITVKIIDGRDKDTK